MLVSVAGANCSRCLAKHSVGPNDVSDFLFQLNYGLGMSDNSMSSDVSEATASLVHRLSSYSFRDIEKPIVTFSPWNFVISGQCMPD